MKITRAGILALCICAAPQMVHAQVMQWTDKGYVSATVGVQVGSHDLSTNSQFDIYGEQATVTGSQKVKSAGIFDIGGAYRVWGRNVLGGVFFSHASSDSSVALNASIPDPAVFTQLRTVTQNISGAKHSENAIHLDGIWMVPFANKIDIGVFAGPSIFFVRQDTITTLSVSEPGPTVAAPLARVKKTTAGLNGGVDVQYLIYKKWAVGGMARYTWASTRITAGSKKLTVGGLQLGAGVRYRF